MEAAFLELGRPSLEEAADLLVARGVERIVIIPYFLTPGMHLERDLPALVERISKKNRNIQVLVTASLDGHPGLVQILADRARAALVEPPSTQIILDNNPLKFDNGSVLSRPSGGTPS